MAFASTSIAKLIMEKFVEPALSKGLDYLVTLGGNVKVLVDKLTERAREFFTKWVRYPTDVAAAKTAASSQNPGFVLAMNAAVGAQETRGALLQFLAADGPSSRPASPRASSPSPPARAWSPPPTPSPCRVGRAASTPSRWRAPRSSWTARSPRR